MPPGGMPPIIPDGSEGDEAPLLVDPNTRHRMERILRRRFVGRNGITVSETADMVTIGLAALGLEDAGGSSGGPLNGVPIVVRVKQTGGGAGSSSSPATWTYDIWPVEYKPSEDTEDEFRLAGGLQPHNRSNQPGRVLAAVTDSYGLAFFNTFEENPALQWVLLIAYNERFETAVCQ